ncbi:MAG: hypothetical protein IJT43_11630 [Stomatobaculum sp.]|nr:hypothetical protein [Stomatobaculum sp.]
MKRTEVKLLRQAGHRLIRVACAGMLAGAMVAFSAMPAMAALTKPQHPAVIPGGVIEDTFTYKLCLEYKGSEKFPNTIPLQIYKIADVVEVPDATNVYEYSYLGNANPDVEANEMVDNCNNNADLNEYIQFYEKNVGSLEVAADLTDEQGNAVREYYLNRTYNIGSGIDACGVYFIRQKDGTSFKIGDTTYTVGSVIISVPNYNAHQVQKDGTEEFTITVNPKPVQCSSTTPPPHNDNPPGGGGNPPTRRYTPPSQGSVLGASRDADPLIPEVLGANRLPQTGQLWWPVPVLCIAGFVLIGSGVRRRKAAAVTTH